MVVDPRSERKQTNQTRMSFTAFIHSSQNSLVMSTNLSKLMRQFIQFCTILTLTYLQKHIVSLRQNHENEKRKTWKGGKPIAKLFIGLDMWKAEISASLSGETWTFGPAVCTLLSQRAQAFCSLIHSIHPSIHLSISPFSLIKAGDRLKDTPKQNMALTVDRFAQVLIFPPNHPECTVVTNCIHQTVYQHGEMPKLISPGHNTELRPYITT